MMAFTLHQQLQKDCYILGLFSHSSLLLHKNALVPWFILVPHTQQTELFKLEPSLHSQVQGSINELADFVDTHFKPDKLNIATLGNIVPQLHIHIIGRFIDDFCWPNPVWGQTDSSSYPAQDIFIIKQALLNKLSEFKLSN